MLDCLGMTKRGHLSPKSQSTEPTGIWRIVAKCKNQNLPQEELVIAKCHVDAEAVEL